MKEGEFETIATLMSARCATADDDASSPSARRRRGDVRDVHPTQFTKQ